MQVRVTVRVKGGSKAFADFEMEAGKSAQEIADDIAGTFRSEVVPPTEADPNVSAAVAAERDRCSDIAQDYADHPPTEEPRRAGYLDASLGIKGRIDGGAVKPDDEKSSADEDAPKSDWQPWRSRYEGELSVQPTVVGPYPAPPEPPAVVPDPFGRPFGTHPLSDREPAAVLPVPDPQPEPTTPMPDPIPSSETVTPSGFKSRGIGRKPTNE